MLFLRIQSCVQVSHTFWNRSVPYPLLCANVQLGGSYHEVFFHINLLNECVCLIFGLIQITKQQEYVRMQNNKLEKQKILTLVSESLLIIIRRGWQTQRTAPGFGLFCTFQ